MVYRRKLGGPHPKPPKTVPHLMPANGILLVLWPMFMVFKCALAVWSIQEYARSDGQGVDNLFLLHPVFIGIGLIHEVAWLLLYASHRDALYTLEFLGVTLIAVLICACMGPAMTGTGGGLAPWYEWASWWVPFWLELVWICYVGRLYLVVPRRLDSNVD